MAKDKIKQLNKSLVSYTDALHAINDNYITLHHLNKDIDDLENEIAVSYTHLTLPTKA